MILSILFYCLFLVYHRMFLFFILLGNRLSSWLLVWMVVGKQHLLVKYLIAMRFLLSDAYVLVSLQLSWWCLSTFPTLLHPFIKARRVCDRFLDVICDLLEETENIADHESMVQISCAVAQKETCYFLQMGLEYVICDMSVQVNWPIDWRKKGPRLGYSSPPQTDDKIVCHSSVIWYIDLVILGGKNGGNSNLGTTTLGYGPNCWEYPFSSLIMPLNLWNFRTLHPCL